MKFIRDNALRIRRTVRNETHSNSRSPEADWRANAAGRGDQMADMRRVSDSGTRDHCEVLSSLDRRAGFPPLDRRGGVALEELRSSQGDTRPVPKVSSLVSRAKLREGGPHLQSYVWSAGRQQQDGKLPEAIQTIQR